MMIDEKLLYVLALQNVPKVGDITAKKLIRHCNSAESIFKEKRSALLKIEGIGTNILNDLFNKDHIAAAERELKFIKNNNIKCHYFLEDTYPERLKHCVDGPILLFERGNINLNNQPVISIVGTRKITPYGRSFCESLIESLSSFNPVIVSGFAYGCDITAQKAALRHNLQTIGCLAHGLNQIYPRSHKKYMPDIEHYGGFFTDFWSTDDFDRNNFLKRNRIIAGLSEATVVIESAEKGGSLVTAEIANSYDREVFSVPGRVNDPQSLGCNNLIKTQRAHLLSNPADIPYILNWSINSENQPTQQALFVELEAEEQMIYDVLNVNGRTLLDHIALKCNMPVHRVASLLLNMELKGIIRPLSGKLFEIC